MGKDSILTEKQKRILGQFKSDDRLSSFYFTGGTALSEYYLKHRQSVDLDFFTKSGFDPQVILEIINSWSLKYGFAIKASFVDPTHIYLLKFKDGDQLKVDFAQYPYPYLSEPEIHNSLKVDSFFDIAVNKFLTINQRTEVKDFVDVYYVLKKFNFWQLKDGVMAKFNIEIDPFLMASDYLKVESFENLHKMYKKLNLDILKKFFRKEAKKLGRKSVK